MLLGNKLRNLFCSPRFLEQLVKFGTRNDVDIVGVTDAVPSDAQIRGAGYDPVRGSFYLTFEHDSFKALEGGELIPEMRPMFTSRALSVEIGPANEYQARSRVIEDIIESCKRNGVWLSHEDRHGAFTFQEESTEEWLREAVKE